jgi:hypothetical protein
LSSFGFPGQLRAQRVRSADIEANIRYLIKELALTESHGFSDRQRSVAKNDGTGVEAVTERIKIAQRYRDSIWDVKTVKLSQQTALYKGYTGEVPLLRRAFIFTNKQEAREVAVNSRRHERKFDL